MPNKFMPIQNGELPAVLGQINNNFAQLDAEAVTKTFNNNQGNIGLVQGRLPNDLGTGTLLYGLDGKALIAMYVDADGQPILKVAKEGYDATTATDAQLAFNSAQNTLRIVKTVPISVTISHTAGTADYQVVSVPHGLTFEPYYNAFNTIDATIASLWGVSSVAKRTNPTSLPVTSGLVFSYSLYQEAYVDATNVYLLVALGGLFNTGSYTFRSDVKLSQETQAA